MTVDGAMWARPPFLRRLRPSDVVGRYYRREGVLTGWIRARSESSSLYDLTPPLRGATSIGGTLDLDLLQSFTRTNTHKRPETRKRQRMRMFARVSFEGETVDLTGLEGGLDGVGVEDAEVRLKDAGILDEDWRSGLD